LVATVFFDQKQGLEVEKNVPAWELS